MSTRLILPDQALLTFLLLVWVQLFSTIALILSVGFVLPWRAFIGIAHVSLMV